MRATAHLSLALAALLFGSCAEGYKAPKLAKEQLATVSLWIAMIASLYSGFEYFFRYGPRLFASPPSE